jgi:hypothetical protein
MAENIILKNLGLFEQFGFLVFKKRKAKLLEPVLLS